jgi:polysaccharide biosynthesis/export protein
MIRSSFSGLLYRLVVLLIASLAPLAPQAVCAQTPSAEQLETFRNLTPEQQQAILDALGRGGSTIGTPSGVGQDRSVRSTPSDLARDQRLRDRRRMSDQERELQGEPRFKPLDTLLLSLDIREVKGQEVTLAPPQPAPPQNGAPTSTPATQAPMTVTTPAAGEPIKRTEAETARLQELRTRILRRNPLQLDKWGILNVPELGPIPLAGLTAEEARQRLAAEPVLADFLVRITYLPVKPVGQQALKPFGAELFELAPDTFAPATDIPVPAEYVVGPGDTLEVQLIGTTSGRFRLVVRRDGRITLPEIGPVAVGGQRFEDARNLIERRVSEQIIGTQASVQMGELRSIQVFVAGDAQQPGSYTVSGLSTITNVLFVSGGPTKVGSLRNIELKRNGQVVTRFDLYDLLLRGDTRKDLRVMAGDVIYIPPIGPTIGVWGEVQRPAIYELQEEGTAGEAVKLAGGLTAEADAQLATIERVSPARTRIVLDVDLTGSGTGTRLQNGDRLQVPTVRPTLEDAVVLQGHVHRPGEYQFRPGLRLSDVIPTLDELKSTADQHYVLIRREVPATRRIEFFSVDLPRALEQRGTQADTALAPRDQVFVFDLETGRDRLLAPLMRELRLQATHDLPTAQVSVGGRVNAPGDYPLEPGMRISDLIRAGGSLDQAAYGGTAELTRNVVDGGEARQTELKVVDLAKVLAHDPEADLQLRPFDYLIVKELPLWSGQEYVEMQGEVRFPGRYPIQRGETLRSVVERAGGLTEFAFVDGAVFTREANKERERQQIENHVRRLKADLAHVALMVSQEGRCDAAQTLAVGQKLLDDLVKAEPTGRLVVNLPAAMNARPGATQDIVLKDGDRLRIPRVTQEVTVIGEVQSPTSHLYSANLSRDDYIALSGGAAQRADKGRIYVVRADGSVVPRTHSWFSNELDIHPGDTIVVPLDAERMRALPLWTQATTIIYNLAVAVAALDII